METNGMSLGGIGFLALFFLIIIAMWHRGNMGYGYNYGYPVTNCSGGECGSFQNYKATVDAQKSEIINTATTQYKIEEQANLTRATINGLSEKFDAINTQNLRDKITEQQMLIAKLQSEAFTTAALNPIMSKLNYIENNMLPKPSLAGVSAVCPNAAVINGLGINGCNCGNCGNYGTL